MLLKHARIERLVRIAVARVYCPKVYGPILRATLTYTVFGTGAIRLNTKFEPLRELPYLHPK